MNSLKLNLDVHNWLAVDSKNEKGSFVNDILPRYFHRRVAQRLHGLRYRGNKLGTSSEGEDMLSCVLKL